MKRGKRRFLVPEVVQTSETDCGPAALAALLTGYGIPASYGRLREICQTEVDGTSIDRIEDVARELGLDATQIMLPVDHVLLAEGGALPCMAIVRTPTGLLHFVVPWRRHRARVQVMDPAVGRRWIRAEQLLEMMHVHEVRVPVARFEAWTQSKGFERALAARLGKLGVGEARELLEAARERGPRDVARLDAAIRYAAELAGAGVLKRGNRARHFVSEVAREADEALPEEAFYARVDDDEVTLRGAVVLDVRGVQAEHAADTPNSGAKTRPELQAALTESAPRPWRELMQLLRGAGASLWIQVLLALVLVSATTVIEALLLRGLIDLREDLRLPTQRAAGLAIALVLLGAMIVVETGFVGHLLRLGRRVELGLRARFLSKLPFLHDRYLRSRPVPDLAHRCHALHSVRQLPVLVGQILRQGLAVLVTAIAITWLDPSSGPLAFAAAGFALAWPVLATRPLAEIDLRVRTHAGALGRFYLDALLGLSPLRAHAASRPLLREHEALLVEWWRAGRRLVHAGAWLTALQGLGYGLAFWMVARFVEGGGALGDLLLLAYWSLAIAFAGGRLNQLVRQLPMQRNTVLRLVEPLHQPELESTPAAARGEGAPPAKGVAIALEDVHVVASGHRILAGADLTIAPGEHVAIVGPSGAGKSSLLGLLLGWHRASEGHVLVDGEPLDAATLDALRGDTAWVEPGLQLWNRSLVDNLRYGAPRAPGALETLPHVLEAADLFDLLERLPAGLETPLGEGGCSVSGGEGQRVRLGRAMARPGARLVLLDEPFRGLDRGQRTRLLQRTRALWPDATLLFVSHDIEDTLLLDRVLVVDNGRIIEDGDPRELEANVESRFHGLLGAERNVLERLGAQWQRRDLVRGNWASTPEAAR